MKLLPAWFVVLAIGVGTLRGGDWPQWRGPYRTGVAIDFRQPAVWPAEAPAPHWRVYVGEGYSSPVVQDGRLFIMGRQSDDLEACICLDAVTGKRLWRHAYPASFKPADATAGLGPKSTPTVDRECVYMLGLGGMFHCFDAQTGHIHWKHDCAAEYWGVEKDPAGDDAWFPSCGSAASALIDGENVILPLGGRKAGAFTAFDRRSGNIAWKALTDRGSYASPMIVELAEARQIVGFTGLRMVGLSAPGGDLLWQYPFPAQFEQTILTPVIWKDLVVVGGERKPTVALRIASADGKVTQTTAWRNSDLRGYLSTSVNVQDHLIGLDDRSERLVCINLGTGATSWKSDHIGRYVSLVVADTKLLALNADGELYVFEANVRDFVKAARWRVSEDGGTWAHLAVAGSWLYIKDKDHVAGFDLEAR